MRKKILLLFLIIFSAITIISCSNSEAIINRNEGNDEGIEQVNVIDEDIALRAMPSWADTAVIYEVNVRQYTQEGTFNAFILHLDRLKAMGVNTLWFMPIHPISEREKLGSLGSYYSVADYKGINPEFGDMDDFKNLVDIAHDMGFKVMLDWVANHTGWDNEWMENKDWYLQDKDGNVVSPLGMGWDDVAQLNFSNVELRKAMIDAMLYWVTEADIDGFRCDHAKGVPIDFWEEARIELSKAKELYMLAEDNSSKALLKTAFDSNYNWNLYDAMVAVAKGNKKAKKIEHLIKAYATLPEGSFPLNFLDNHDKNSWEGTIIEKFGEDSLPAFTTLLFTIPGVPLVYSGQEAGLDKRLEFFEKDQIDWSTLPYEDIITKLTQIKTEYSALYNGLAGADISFIANENANILAYDRIKDNKKITVILNLSKDEQDSVMDYDVNENSIVLLHGNKEHKAHIEEKSMTKEIVNGLNSLKPWEYYVIVTSME